ncbi:MAG TPA: WD40 repeat domain-containing protein [Gemmataceae bacterium]|jgi:WD40 repeat protein
MKRPASRSGVFGIVALLLVTSLPLSAQESKLLYTMTHSSRDVDYRDPVAVAFSGDGKMLASAGYWTVRLWDVATGKQKVIIKYGDGIIQTVAVSSDGKMVASSVGGMVKLWDAATGKHKATLVQHGPPDIGMARCVRFSGDGKLLAATGSGKTILLWDVASQVEVQAKRDEQIRLAREAMARKEKEKVNNERIIQLEKEIGAEDKPKAILTGHTGGVLSVAFSSDSKLLASASEDATVKLWEVATGKEKVALEHKGRVTSVALSSDGKTLASDGGLESSFMRLRLWDITTGKEKAKLKPDAPYGWRVHTVAFSSDGKTVASATDGTFVSLWDVATGKQKGMLKKGWPGAGEGIVLPSSVAFTPDLKLLAVGVGGKEAKVYLWKMPSTKKADE